MFLEKALLEIQPDAKRVNLCRPAFHYRLEVPAFTDERILVPVNDNHALLINARAGFSMDLAANLIAHVLKAEYVSPADGAISVIGGLDSSFAPFDSVVCVPPPTPRQFKSQSDALADATTWILPAYNCEFRDGQSGQEFYSAAFERPRIPVMAWDRQPEPQLRVQLLAEWNGGMYKRTKTPFVDSLSSIVTAVAGIPPNVGLRIADLYDRHIDIESNGHSIRYVFTDGTQTSTGEFAVEEIVEHIRRFGVTGTLG
jgi:hypothetical protein